jgi:methionyl-tRNA formyltransferase
VLAAYGHLIPQSILDIPAYGSLNVHPSLLPKYRGPSPVQTAILNGEEQTGVTIMVMDKEIDHGPIVAQQVLPTPLSSLTYTQAKKELSILGGTLLATVIPQWMEGAIKAVPQKHEDATYTEHLTRDHGTIDWSQSAVEIERQVRAFNPWPGTSTFTDGKRLKIFKVLIGGDSANEPGTVSAGPEHTLAVATKDMDILIASLQLEGRNKVSSKEFLLGNSQIIGTKVG